MINSPVELKKHVLYTNKYFIKEGKEGREEGVIRKEESMVQRREGSNEQTKAISSKVLNIRLKV